MGEGLIGITDGPVPGKMLGVINEPADQALTSPDRAGREVPCQLLLFPAREHVRVHKMRTSVKETPEIRGIIGLRGTSNPSTLPRAA